LDSGHVCKDLNDDLEAAVKLKALYPGNYPGNYYPGNYPGNYYPGNYPGNLSW
jgi:hypothetical protein